MTLSDGKKLVLCLFFVFEFYPKEQVITRLNRFCVFPKALIEVPFVSIMGPFSTYLVFWG